MRPLICSTEKALAMRSSGSWLQCMVTGGTGAFTETSSSSQPGTHHTCSNQAPWVVGKEAFHLTMKQQFCKQLKMQNSPSFDA